MNRDQKIRELELELDNLIKDNKIKELERQIAIEKQKNSIPYHNPLVSPGPFDTPYDKYKRTCTGKDNWAYLGGGLILSVNQTS